MGAAGRRLRACAAAAVVLAATAAGVHGGSAAAANPGVMVAWGSDADGQLGNATARGQLKAGAVPAMTGVIQMDGGREHVVVLKQNGTSTARRPSRSRA
jgi:alpha-tubulin suppressor-like RCC1 family protein